MNTIDNQAEITVPQILAGLLPVISDEVKKTESAEAAMAGVQKVYEQTTISHAIKFSQIATTVQNAAQAMVEFYEAIGIFQPQLKAAA